MPATCGLPATAFTKRHNPWSDHDHLVSEERVQPFAYAGALSADFLIGGTA